MGKICRILPENPYWNLIQEAYRVFRVPIPQDLEVCNLCCMLDEQQDRMKQYESQNIPLHLIEEWYSAATNYPVSKNLWSYILPRALEILAVGENPTHSLEIVLDRYPTGERKRWTEEQWQVLDTFQKKFIESDMRACAPSTCFDNLDDKLCMFARSGWNVDDLFDQIYNLPMPLLVETLYNDWTGIGDDPQIWISTFWEDPDKIELKWTAKILYDRLFNYGIAADSPKYLSDQALELVNVISRYQDD